MKRNSDLLDSSYSYADVDLRLMGVRLLHGGWARLFISAILIFVAGGVLGMQIELPKERYGKCEFNRAGALQERLEAGWDINTVVATREGGLHSVALHSIFDVVCVGETGIDATLALAYLRNGGRVTMDQLKQLYQTAKENRDNGPDEYADLFEYLRKIGFRQDL